MYNARLATICRRRTAPRRRNEETRLPSYTINVSLLEVSVSITYQLDCDMYDAAFSKLIALLVIEPFLSCFFDGWR